MDKKLTGHLGNDVKEYYSMNKAKVIKKLKGKIVEM